MNWPVVIELRGVELPTGNTQRGRHWSRWATDRKRWEQMLLSGVGDARKARLLRQSTGAGQRMRVEVFSLSPRRRDPRNLEMAMKVVEDALMNIGFLKDDDRAHLDCPPVREILTQHTRSTILHISPIESDLTQ